MLRQCANKEFDFERLRHLVVAMVHENPQVSPKALAEAIGKSYSTLCRETNPSDHGAKLGLEDFIKLTLLTADFGPMRFIAVDSGFFAQPDGEAPDAYSALSNDSLAMEMARRFFRLMQGWMLLKGGGEEKVMRKALLRDLDEYLQFVLHWKHTLEVREG